jgi:trk system potassium uptake protein TrkA
MRIVIVGLGDIGKESARKLIEKEENEVVLIDNSEEVTETIAEEFDVVTLKGDGSNPEILKKAKLDEADALIALTGSDPINLVIAMIAKQWEVKKIVIKLSRISLRPAVKEIMEEVMVVMPHVSAANEIIQTIYGKEKSKIAEAIGGALYQDTVEVEEREGDRIEDLDLPEDSLIIAVQREDEVLLAKGSLRLKKGDLLIVLSESEKTLSKLKKIFARNEEKK